MQCPIDSTALVLVDVQERLVNALPDIQPRLPKVITALKAAAALNLDVIVTEQYPKGLGPTLADVRAACPAGAPVIEKTSFSCWGEENFRLALKAKKRQTVVLMGIEAHVCVQQTAFDLLVEAYEVVLLADAVASRNAEDCRIALELMRAKGVWVTTTESFLFSLLGSAKHPGFKAVSALVK